jgi:predicted metalloprotease with PDZ domain
MERLAKVESGSVRREVPVRRPGLLVLAALVWLVPPAMCSPAVRYTVSLSRASEHLVDIKIEIPFGNDERELQLPVWNALYQVRDFSQYVLWVHERKGSETVEVPKLDKSRWKISGAQNGAEVEYEMFCDQPGPYDAQLNPQHAFFNLAEILMYPVDARSLPMHVQFVGMPAAWHVATTMKADEGGFSAGNYDQLVDSPVELGTFAESDFDAKGGYYRIVIDADRADYNMQKIVDMARKVVVSATGCMNDRPFETYMFLYHFPHESTFGGMEHAESTAITVDARLVKDDPQRLADVTAHEFFHLWNVKRIRPQSLEPVDYNRENYTRALWFSEGVTSSVEDFVMLRAGLMNEAQFRDRLGDQIATLENPSAHRNQSAEESSLDAWLEKYSYYRLPERSISYYNKGYLLGILLDLKLRETSQGKACLRELFQWMNANFAKQGRFFPDSDGVRQAAEAVGGGSYQAFFEKYVAGIDEIPWDEFFSAVGLRVIKKSTPIADLGFAAQRGFDAPPTVTRVSPNSEAERQGLAVGDVLLEINGHVVSSDFLAQLGVLQPGDTVRLQVRSPRGQRELHWKLGTRNEVEYELHDVEHLTQQQKTRRAAWLRGEAESRSQP